MSDDYHDDDSHSGGLWDPDVVNPPPAPRRPTLRAVPPAESHGFETLGVADVEPEEERLVRLDEFRSMSQEEDELLDLARRRTSRRILLAAATIVGVIAIAGAGLVAFVAGDGNPTRPAALSPGPADVEQAALTRAVKSAASHHRLRAGGDHRPAPRSTRARDAAKTHQGKTDASSPRDKSTQATTLVSQRAPAPTTTARITTSASSQRASAACEFPPC
jgi:hypothetical protein